MISIPFTVAITTNGVVNDSEIETFTVRVNNDRSYASTSPSTVTIEAGGGTANGTVTLTVPSTAASGTDITLTIEAENAAATDINYTVLRFSVAAKVLEKRGIGINQLNQIPVTFFHLSLLCLCPGDRFYPASVHSGQYIN